MTKLCRVALVTCLLTIGLSSAAWAQGFTVANLQGGYSFRLFGTNLDAFVTAPVQAEHAIPVFSGVAATGVFTADGLGNITGGSISWHLGMNLCGGPLAPSVYHVELDGEGDLTLLFPNVQPTFGTQGSSGSQCFLLTGLTLTIALGDLENGKAETLELANMVSNQTLSNGTSAIFGTVLSGAARLQRPVGHSTRRTVPSGSP